MHANHLFGSENARPIEVARFELSGVGSLGAVESHTGYARLGAARIAFQVIGGGPIDLISTPGSFVSFDISAEDPAADLYYRSLASFTRLIRFDRRGSGASDPVPLDALPALESYTEEVLAVMDAVGSQQAAVMAGYDAGPMAMLFAATQPERVSALILANTTSRYLSVEDYPIGLSRDAAEHVADLMAENWGTEAQASLYVPSRADDARFLAWFAKVQRMTISPTAAAAYFRAWFEVDARPLLSAIRLPTLVLHRSGFSSIPFTHAQYIADHVAGARVVELPGSDGPFIWEHPELALDAIEEFLTGIRRGAPSHRVLATVLFTDIVDSTQRAEELGDRKWRALLDVHDDLAARSVESQGGRVVKSTGDGILATFDGPGRAIRGATALQDELGRVQINLRAGIHAGEIEVRGDDVSGIAVHLAARVMAEADPGEILVSRTVRDLVVGSDISFSDRGAHQLKGIEGDWQLYSVIRPGAAG
jgi:class 3 adenylate cyclase/pimeloyl-ACP methyl ester carboxylesterase